MIFSKIIVLVLICVIINVQADLIGWNRGRNNGLQHKLRLHARSAENKHDLLDQYQLFFSSKGRNKDFIKARRSIQTL